MRNRRKMSNRGSKKYFSKNAGMHWKNTLKPARGGIRF